MPIPGASSVERIRRLSQLTDFDLKKWRGSVFVGDAMRKIRPRTYLSNDQLWLYEVYHSRVRRLFKFLVVIVHLLLALFERPKAFHFLPGWGVGIVQVLCILFYTAEVVVKTSFRKRSSSVSTTRWTTAKTTILALMFVDLIIQFSTGFDVWHFTRVLRPFFLIEEVENLRRLFENVLRTIVNVLDVVFLELILILVFGVIAFIIESDQRVDDPFFPDPDCGFNDDSYNNNSTFDFRHFCTTNEGNCQKFSNLYDSIIRFVVLLTTANYPDITMCMYTRSWWYSFFFAAFLLAGNYFLLNLVVAIVYMHYKNHSKTMALTTMVRIQASLDAAFDEIREIRPGFPDGVVSLDMWRGMIMRVRSNMSREHATFLFYLIDQDDSGYITRPEFYMVFDVLHLQIRCERPNAIPTFHQRLRQRLHPLIINRYFDMGINIAVLLNIVLLLFVVSNDLDDSAVTVFPFVFAVEILLKMYILKPKHYLGGRLWNQFDAVLTFSGLISWVASSSIQKVPVGIANIIVSLRILRVFRLLASFQRFNRIFQTFVDIFPILRTYMALQTCFFYVFGMVGMDLFAGIVREEHCTCIGCPLLMFKNTFDDFPTAFITLFQLMVVNNWQYNMDMHTNATGTRVTRLFFVTFYFVSVVVMISLVVAFILEAFLLEWEINKESKQRQAALMQMGERVGSRAGLHPFKFSVVRQRMGMTAVLFDIHKDELAAQLGHTEYNPKRASELHAMLGGPKPPDSDGEDEAHEDHEDQQPKASQLEPKAAQLVEIQPKATQPMEIQPKATQPMEIQPKSDRDNQRSTVSGRGASPAPGVQFPVSRVLAAPRDSGGAGARLVDARASDASHNPGSFVVSGILGGKQRRASPAPGGSPRGANEEGNEARAE